MKYQWKREIQKWTCLWPRLKMWGTHIWRQTRAALVFKGSLARPLKNPTTNNQKSLNVYIFSRFFLNIWYCFLGGKQEFLCVCLYFSFHKVCLPQTLVMGGDTNEKGGRSLPFEFCNGSLAPTAVCIAHVPHATSFKVVDFIRRNSSVRSTIQIVELFRCDHLDFTGFTSVVCLCVFFYQVHFVVQFINWCSDCVKFYSFHSVCARLARL